MQLLQVLAILFLSLSLTDVQAGIGLVTEQTGPTEIVRQQRSLPSRVNAAVETNDTVITAAARAQLTFDDKTTVRMTEQSKLLIDDFVYDANRGAGKLALKVALGTARYASGQIAKTNPQQVAVKTPTATIAVRGTDFSMTVDELGRSMITLLPSCDQHACVTGKIEVSNDAGSVIMDVAYQTTYVTALDVPPKNPVIVRVDASNLDNLLIVSPPPELKQEEFAERAKTALDINFLDQNFLAYDELNKDLLSTKGRLDKNYLDGELLANALEIDTASMLSSAESILATNQLLPGFQASSLLKWSLDDENRLILRRDLGNALEIWLPSDQSAIVEANQAGLPLYQQVNQGGSTRISITQR